MLECVRQNGVTGMSSATAGKGAAAVEFGNYFFGGTVEMGIVSRMAIHGATEGDIGGRGGGKWDGLIRCKMSIKKE